MAQTAHCAVSMTTPAPFLAREGEIAIGLDVAEVDIVVADEQKKDRGVL